MPEIKNRATLDSTQFQSGLQKMQGGVKNLHGVMRALPGIGGALSAAGVAAAAKQAMDMADEIDNLSTRMGVGAETVQAYKVALEESGLSMGDLESAINRLDRAKAEAISGNKAYQKSFESLGITQDKLSSLNTEDTLEIVGQKMGELEGSADATAASYDLLGRSAGKMRQILIDMNRDGIQSQIDAYKELGLVIDEAMIKELDLAQLQLDRAGRKMSNWFAKQTANALDFGRVIKAMSTGMSFDEALYATQEQDVAALRAKRESEKKREDTQRAATEFSAGEELAALKEKMRLEELSAAALKDELTAKLAIARAEYDHAEGVFARLDALKRIHELEGDILSIKEEAAAKTLEESGNQIFSMQRRIGGNATRNDGIFEIDRGKKDLEVKAQKTRDEQLRELRKINDGINKPEQGAVL